MRSSKSGSRGPEEGLAELEVEKAFFAMDAAHEAYEKGLAELRAEEADDWVWA